MPGEEVDVSVDLVAPQEHGRYVGYWRLTGPMGRKKWGQRFWTHIHVVDPRPSRVRPPTRKWPRRRRPPRTVRTMTTMRRPTE